MTRLPLSGVLDSSNCDPDCLTCHDWRATWLVDDWLGQWPVTQVRNERQLAEAIVQQSQVAESFVVASCRTELEGVGIQAVVNELRSSDASTVCICPMLADATGDVLAPLPFPTGGWLRIDSRAWSSEPQSLPTTDLVATSAMVFKGRPIEASGVSRDVDWGKGAEFDQLLRGLRRRGYRLALGRTMAVTVESVDEAAPGTLPYVSESSDVRTALLERSERYLRRVRSHLLYANSAHTSRPWLLIDGRGIPPRHNGTAVFGLRMIDALVARCPSVRIWVEQDTSRFHGLADRWGALVVDRPDWEHRYGHVFRVNQIWSREDLRVLHEVAASYSLYMHDIILWDTDPHVPDLGHVYQSVADTADALFFNSMATQRRFLDEFPRLSALPCQVIPLSLCPNDYQIANSAVGSTILVMGNGYPHKDVEWGVDLLRAAFPYETVTSTLGRGEDGLIDEASMAEIIGSAKIVVFPSHYEGFGIPVMEALANGKPILVRDSSVNRELHELTGSSAIRLFRYTEDLLESVAELLADAKGDHSSVSAEHDWTRAGASVVSAIREAMRNPFGPLWSQREYALADWRIDGNG